MAFSALLASSLFNDPDFFPPPRTVASFTRPSLLFSTPTTVFFDADSDGDDEGYAYGFPRVFPVNCQGSSSCRTAPTSAAASCSPRKAARPASATTTKKSNSTPTPAPAPAEPAPKVARTASESPSHSRRASTSLTPTAQTQAAAPAQPSRLPLTSRLGATDIRETDTAYVLTVDVPGLEAKDVRVQLSDENVLTISGQRTAAAEATHGKLHRSERAYGAFVRRFALPSDTDGSAVAAAVDHGVLQVRVGKRTRVAADIPVLSGPHHTVTAVDDSAPSAAAAASAAAVPRESIDAMEAEDDHKEEENEGHSSTHTAIPVAVAASDHDGGDDGWTMAQ